MNPALAIRDYLLDAGYSPEQIDDASFCKLATYCEEQVADPNTRVRPFDPAIEQAAQDAAEEIVVAFLATARLRHAPVELVEVSEDKYGQLYARWRILDRDMTIDSRAYITLEGPNRTQQLRLDQKSWPWFVKRAFGDRPSFARP